MEDELIICCDICGAELEPEDWPFDLCVDCDYEIACEEIA